MSALFSSIGDPFSSLFFCSHRKLKKAIDPNVVVVDPTAILDPEIDHIQKEFQKLVHRLKKKLAGDPDAEDESPEGIKAFLTTSL